MTDKSSIFKRLLRIAKNLLEMIDLRAGALGAVVFGSIVWVINWKSTTPPDYHGAAIAAINQAIYTFFFGGLLFRFASWLALRPGKDWTVLTTAIVLPTLIAVGMVYVIHSHRGTPSPLLSTIPTAVLSLIIMPTNAIRLRLKSQKT